MSKEDFVKLAGEKFDAYEGDIKKMVVKEGLLMVRLASFWLPSSVMHVSISSSNSGTPLHLARGGGRLFTQTVGCLLCARACMLADAERRCFDATAFGTKAAQSHGRRY